MRYLCLIYYDRAKVNALSADEKRRIESECARFRRDGHQLMAVILEESSASASSPAIHRIPDALSLIAARDLNEAIRCVGQMPTAPYASVEIRAVRRQKNTKNKGNSRFRAYSDD